MHASPFTAVNNEVNNYNEQKGTRYLQTWVEVGTMCTINISIMLKKKPRPFVASCKVLYNW